jgi:cell division protein FtsI (penicillin-binding protein 3)
LGAPLVPGTDDASAKSPAKADQHVAVIPNSAPLGGAKIVDVSTGPMVTTPATSPDTDSLAALRSPNPAAAPAPSGSGTVVLDVDSGIVVPSFMGKSLRTAVEVAQQSGLEISVVGSGIARQQSPLPGSHLPAGQKVTIRFSH